MLYSHSIILQANISYSPPLLHFGGYLFLKEGNAVADSIDQEEWRQILHSLLELGELLIDSGAEISRVEDTLTRLGLAYRAARVDVFAIPSSIVMTISLPEGETLTETRRISSAGTTDFTRLERLNELSRRCCSNPLHSPELCKEISVIKAARKPFGVFLAGSLLAAGSFAIFFGGTLPDGIAAAIFAFGICILQDRLGRTKLDTVAFNLVVSLLVGLGVALVTKLIPGLHMDKILIGDIMLLIPGIAMTNAVRNILVGNTISGVMRLTESLVWTASLAGGFTVSIWIVDILL